MKKKGNQFAKLSFSGFEAQRMHRTVMRCGQDQKWLSVVVKFPVIPTERERGKEIFSDLSEIISDCYHVV